ncbi:septation protein IspZ [Nitratireductor sp. XY-223]|uniref:inner membrane-spanning protein YciB n=1 Tax=Nitratireductor sp. XY-223 TaxID=2561926 RepID=UPI0010AB0D7A|nr:septation protein IspZ [Nitratireductor sp. XY-223]
MLWLFSAIEELAPVLVFFLVQQYFGFAAGLVAMTLLVVLLLALSFGLGRAVPRFAVISTAVFLLFSVPSILTGDSAYFQVSDTILDGIFAVLLLGSWALRLPLLKFLFERVFAITDEAWRILSLRWGLLFLVLAFLNEFFRQGFSVDVWAQFKLISTIAILAFGCYQFTLSARMRIRGESNRLGLRI